MPTAQQLIDQLRDENEALKREGTVQAREIAALRKAIEQANTERFVTAEQEIRLGIVKAGCFNFSELRMVEAAEAYVRGGFQALTDVLVKWQIADGSTTHGIEAIRDERLRQVNDEGWDANHDDEHDRDQLVLAAANYALEHTGHGDLIGDIWPWDEEWWKPGEPIRNLIKAGALIAAEIDRLERRDDDDAYDA